MCLVASEAERLQVAKVMDATYFSMPPERLFDVIHLEAVGLSQLPVLRMRSS